MRNLHKSKNYTKAEVGETVIPIPQNHGSAVGGRCKCGKPSAMVWIRQLGFSLENKYWCERCFAGTRAATDRPGRRQQDISADKKLLCKHYSRR